EGPETRRLRAASADGGPERLRPAAAAPACRDGTQQGPLPGDQGDWLSGGSDCGKSGGSNRGDSRRQPESAAGLWVAVTAKCNSSAGASRRSRGLGTEQTPRRATWV